MYVRVLLLSQKNILFFKIASNTSLGKCSSRIHSLTTEAEGENTELSYVLYKS